MPTLDDLRDDIDRVDEVLVRLLNERARVACEIGRLKKELGIEVYQPEREKQVLAHVRGVAAEGPLGPDAIARLFERIIDEARRLERRLIHGEAEGIGEWGDWSAGIWARLVSGDWRDWCQAITEPPIPIPNHQSPIPSRSSQET